MFATAVLIATGGCGRSDPGLRSNTVWAALVEKDYDKLERIVRKHPEQLNADISGGHTRTSNLTPLFQAAYTADDRALTILCKAGADPNRRSVLGMAPLHYAQSADAVRELVAAGASVEARSDTGESPLSWACRMNRPPEVVEALLEAGAHDHAFGDLGLSALSCLLLNTAPDDENRLQMIEALSAHGAAKRLPPGAAMDYLSQAVHLGSKRLIYVLLDGGADVHARFDAPLRALASSKSFPPEEQLAIARRLVDAGAEVDPSWRENDPSPLERAVQGGNLELATFLRERGATEPDGPPKSRP
jgi:ankyrin repeat protein